MASISAQLYDLPSAEQAEKNAENRAATAKKRFESIKKAGVSESTSSLRIGWNAYALKRDNEFGVLGFETEDEARIAAGIGRSTWYANLRLAEAFNGLEEEQFVSMKLINASALADLPESKRLSREWVRMAGSMSIKAFSEKVDEEMEGKARSSDSKEQGVVLKMSMPLSRKKVVEEGLQEYAASIGIENGDMGKAIEMLVEEKTQEVSLVESITTAVAQIEAAKQLKSSGLSSEETLEKVYGILDEILLGFHEALSTLRTLEVGTA